MPRTVTQGAPEPLGVTLWGSGVNVAVFSAHATAIEFCLFDAAGSETRRVYLPERTGDVFHGHIDAVSSGARYGLRAYGPHDPANGHRFNPSKLLLDPYATAIDRKFRLNPSMFAIRDGQIDDTDSAAAMPKAIVVPPGVYSPGKAFVPWTNTILYELHVRGFTQRHPDVPAELRGRFAGLGHPAAIEHLTSLGITSVEILPAAAWIEELFAVAGLISDSLSTITRLLLSKVKLSSRRVLSNSGASTASVPSNISVPKEPSILGMANSSAKKALSNRPL